MFNLNNLQRFLKYPLAILGMLFLLQFLGFYTFQAGALELETAVRVNLHESGRTIVHLPPLGRIKAPTHNSPLDLHFTLKNIHLEKIADMHDDKSALLSRLPLAMTNEIKTNMLKYFAFLLILSFCLGTGSAFLWCRHRVNKKEALSLGIVNVSVLSLLFLLTAFTYDAESFSRAEYEGMVEATPLVLQVLEQGHKLVEDLGEQFGDVVKGVTFLQQEIEASTGSSGEEGKTLSLLHVSDIHNNPAAFQLIRRVLDHYEVDLIVDTGDLVDFGTTLELNLLVEALESLSVPYIFVPGNHESPTVVGQLKSVRNVTVLEEGILQKKGLRIAAIADPSASYHTSVVADEEMLEASAKKLMDIVDNGKGVDVVAAHNPALFRFLRNNGNLLLGGHMHRSSVSMGDNYIEINAGSSGASGIRGLQNMQMEYNLVLVNFTLQGENAGWLPQTVDLLTVNQFPLHFNFERYFLE